MQIFPVNQNYNTPVFKGKFKSNPTLEILMGCSEKNVLGRFNDVLERASKVDDKMVYKITKQVKSEHTSKGKVLDCLFFLHKFSEGNEANKILEDAITFNYTMDFGSENLLKKHAEVLEKFLPKLENLYPKTDFKGSKSDIIFDIKKKLI